MHGGGSADPGTSWAQEEFGIGWSDRGSPVGLTLDDLVRIGLRRNPRRAQLLVSTVLGKHLPADPRVVAGMGRLLGALVGRALGADDAHLPASPVPAGWRTAAMAAASGRDPAALLAVLDGDRPASPRHAPSGSGPVLTIGFAETATALGHLVADQLGSDYLHSTRRWDGTPLVTAEFSEPHSHATGHLLRPAVPDLLADSGPAVLVDDELSTGRTALNIIRALQAIRPRARYVLAGLVDVRSESDEQTCAAVADELGCRIDVVSLLRGEITVPPGTVARVAAELVAGEDASPVHAGAATVDRLELPWPQDVPDGGRHGFAAGDRPAFDAAVTDCAAVLAGRTAAAQRVLVIGTEEFMYLPLRLALALSRDPSRQIAFQSTTRSPVHVIDRVDYPIRRRIDFVSAGHPGADERSALVTRHLYNAYWPGATGRKVGEADLIVLVDDGHARPGPDGLASAVAAATGVSVLLAAPTSVQR